MGAGQSKEPEPVKVVKKATKKAGKEVDKAADKANETLSIFSKKVEKIVEPEKEECKLRDALPVVGVIALAVAVGAYLYKKKPWKKGDA